MSLSGTITDGHESLKHFIIKCLIYYYCRKLKHKVSMEFVTSQAIFDVYDHTTGIVYEPIQICNTKTIKSKTERYCLYAGVKDMIILELKQFKATETIFEWAANVQKQIVP